jgi:hypothetical protein
MTATGVDSIYWPSLSLVTLGPLPREDMGAGTGFYNLNPLLGGSFGIALLAVIFDQCRSLHRSNLVEHLTVTNPLLQERLSQLQALVLERGEAPAGSPTRPCNCSVTRWADRPRCWPSATCFGWWGCCFCWRCRWCC